MVFLSHYWAQDQHVDYQNLKRKHLKKEPASC
uniref:Uncharacterized protein n=1 Tax=Arundo donax TaxID=35708 RepID=A0A0A9FFD0_ARUDO